MARGTRLFQEAGSPLIQGHSRRERPFWQPWLGGLLAGFAVFLVVMKLWGVKGGLTLGFVMYCLVAAALGSVIGAAASKAWGVTNGWWLAALGAFLGASAVWLTIGMVALRALNGM